MTDFEKILVVRVGHGGDLVMITPALNAILDAFPDADVHLLTTPEGGRVMKGYHPRLTRVWVYHRRFPHHLWLRRKLRRELLKQHYTIAYVFESNPHYHRMLEGVASVVSRIEDHHPGVHYCDRCLDLVADSAGVPIERGWITLPISAAGMERARALLANHGIEPGTMLIGLHPTFSGSAMPFFRDRRGMRHRVWPRKSFARLARGLDERARAMQMPIRIVVDTLPDERSQVEPIVEQSGGAVTLLTAPPDFERYKGVLKCLDVLVTPNTGPMHIAAAVGTPVVALFSGWSADECGPFVPADRFRVLSAEEAAHPKRGLAAISPDRVADTVFRFLPGAGKS